MLYALIHDATQAQDETRFLQLHEVESRQDMTVQSEHCTCTCSHIPPHPALRHCAELLSLPTMYLDRFCPVFWASSPAGFSIICFNGLFTPLISKKGGPR